MEHNIDFYKPLANEIHDLFTALVLSGFHREEAMELTKAYIAGMIQCDNFIKNEADRKRHYRENLAMLRTKHKDEVAYGQTST